MIDVIEMTTQPTFPNDQERHVNDRKPVYCEYSDLDQRFCSHCRARGIQPERMPSESPRAVPHFKLRVVDPFESPREPKAPDALLKIDPRIAGGGMCGCGAPTRDDAYLCDDCGDELARMFGGVTWLEEQLNLTITRQRAKAISPGGGGSGERSMFHQPASDALSHLRNHLVNTVRMCQEDHVRHAAPAWIGDPEDTLASISGWLLWRVDGLAFHPAAVDILQVSLQVEARSLEVIDRPADQRFVGMCKTVINDVVCNGPVFAPDGDKLGRCRRCNANYPAETARDQLEKSLDDKLFTAPEIAEISTYLNLKIKRQKVHDVIRQWDKRGVITPKQHNRSGQPQYRYGDVRGPLSRYEIREEKRA